MLTSSGSIRRARRVRGALWGLPLSLVVAAPGAFAQLPGPLPVPASMPATEPAPIASAAEPAANPLSDLPSVLERSAALVRRATQDDGSAVVAEVERTLPELATTIARLRSTQAEALTGSPTRVMLEMLQRVWSRLGSELDLRQQQTHALSVGLERDLSELSEQSRALLAAHAQLGQRGGQDDTLATIDRMLHQTARVEEAVRRRQLVLLGLQSRIAVLNIDVAQSADDLTALTESSVEPPLLRFDAPPLWEAFPARGSSSPDRSRNTSAPAQAPQPSGSGTPPPGPPEAGADQALVLRQFGTVLLTSATEQLGLWVVFVLPMVLLRRSAPRWSRVENPAVQALVSVARRPVSAALLPTFMAGAIWRGRVTLDSTLLLLPLLRVIPRLLPARFRPLLWGVAGVFIANHLIVLNLARTSLPGRLAASALIIAAAVVVRRLARASRDTGDSPALQELPPVIRNQGLSLLAALPVVALVAEVAGLTALASHLVNGIVGTLFGASLLFGFLRISHGFLQLAIETPEGALASYFTREPEGLALRLAGGIRWVARLFLALLVLENFDLMTPLLQESRRALGYRFEIGAVEFTIGSVLILAGTIAGTLLFSKVLRFFLDAAVWSRVRLARGVGEMVSKLLHYGLVTTGFLFAISAAGLDLNRFTMLMGALGVGIGLGLQSVVGNFMSGLILLVERPFGIGDVVTAGDVTGTVTDIGIRSTRLRTWSGADIAVPNSNLTSATVTNWSLTSGQRGNEISVGVAYGSDSQVVIRLLETAAREQPTVLPEPPPAALFSGFGPSSLDFTLRYWTTLADFLAAKSALHTTIYRRLGEAGIEIPFPQQDVRLMVEATEATTARANAASAVTRPVATVEETDPTA